MIKSKAIRKIYLTTLSLFIVLVVGTIQNICNKDTLKVNLEIEDVTGLTNYSVYLLNEKDYLVKKNIFIDSDDMEEKIHKVIGYLKESSNAKYSSSLRGVIPSKCKLLDVIYDEEFVMIDFSKELLDSDDLNVTVTSIVYSIYDLKKIKGITILVDGNPLEGYPYVLTKELDINKDTEITKREEINKVVIYYLLEDKNETYYVPVTKYLNDSREKIAIIVDELVSSTQDDLVSYVNSNVELIESRQENDMFILNFNNYLFDNRDEVLEEVLYCISYSVFDNYDVSTVMFEVDGEKISQIYKDDIG